MLRNKLSLPDLTFYSPSDLYEQAKQEMDQAGMKVLYAAGHQHQKTREKWCASMLGFAYQGAIQPCRLAVNDTKINPEADFYLEADKDISPFQLVETMPPDKEKERGKIYRDYDEGKLTSLPYSPATEGEMGPSWVKEKVAKKATKYGVGNSIHLAVYANFSIYQLNRDNYVEAVKPYIDSFASIWMVSNAFVTTLHAAGKIGSIPELFQVIRPDGSFASLPN